MQMSGKEVNGRTPPPNQKTSLPLLSAPWKDKPFDFVCKASLEIYACMRLWSLHLNFYKGVQVGSGKKKKQQEKPSSHFLYSNICINVPLLNIYVALNLYFLMQQMLILIYLLWAVQC